MPRRRRGGSPRQRGTHAGGRFFASSGVSNPGQTKQLFLVVYFFVRDWKKNSFFLFWLCSGLAHLGFFLPQCALSGVGNPEQNKNKKKKSRLCLGLPTRTKGKNPSLLSSHLPPPLSFSPPLRHPSGQGGNDEASNKAALAVAVLAVAAVTQWVLRVGETKRRRKMTRE